MREPLWAGADSALLTEFEPELGIVPPERTVVKVLANADVLVFGIRCDDPDPGRITSFSRARDADLSAEDHVRLVLDPFLNEQSGYVFAVNPDGARSSRRAALSRRRLAGAVGRRGASMPPSASARIRSPSFPYTRTSRKRKPMSGAPTSAVSACSFPRSDGSSSKARTSSTSGPA